jgi:hypothetical protein
MEMLSLFLVKQFEIQAFLYKKKNKFQAMYRKKKIAQLG